MAAVALTVALGSSAGASSTRWFQPIMRLSDKGVATTRCILWAESRSTLKRPNMGDPNPFQFGPFQFTTILWNRWSWVAGVGHKTSSWFLGTLSLSAVTIPAYRATLRQQALVFVTVVRHDGFSPWTNYDGC